MVIELMQPAGPDLARRWLAALLLVPREEREATVAAVEARVNALYPMRAVDRGEELEVVHAPVQREGYVEEVRTTYAQVEVRGKPARRARAR
jgi:hypothetical protein